LPARAAPIFIIKELLMARIITVLLCVFTVSCDRGDTVSKFAGVSNVREVPGNYIMYEIENGTVTCKEHKHRPELTCWKNK
jgi:hypothetical protein